MCDMTNTERRGAVVFNQYYAALAKAVAGTGSILAKDDYKRYKERPREGKFRTLLQCLQCESKHEFIG